MIEKNETQINLNHEPAHGIERFMVDNNLFTCASIGEKVGLSRERVRQIFNTREDLDFKEMKARVVRRKFKSETSKMYNWKLITFVDTKHPYYVSDCGQVARDVKYKKHGIELTKRKLLKPSANKTTKYLRINLTLSTGEHKTFYLQQVVANELLGPPDKNRRLRGVTFIDGDVTNCHKDNLEWLYIKDS